MARSEADSWVYVYYVPELQAIKIGFGDDAEARMRAYKREYSLTVDERSLRKFQLPSRSIATAIEAACHQAVLDAGLKRINHSVAGKEAQELFALGAVSLGTAFLLVAGAIDEEVSRLHDALGRIKPDKQERARQKSDIAKQRIKEEKAARRLQIEREADRCETEIKEVWATYVQPLLDTLAAAKRQFDAVIDPPRNALQKLFTKDLYYPDKVLISPHLHTLVPYVERAFHQRRRARDAYIRIHNKYSWDGISAAIERCDRNVRQPLESDDYGSNHIKMYGPIGEVIDIGKYIYSLDSESMRSVVGKHPALLALVRFAQDNPRQSFVDKWGLHL